MRGAILRVPYEVLAVNDFYARGSHPSQRAYLHTSGVTVHGTHFKVDWVRTLLLRLGVCAEAIPFMDRWRECFDTMSYEFRFLSTDDATTLPTCAAGVPFMRFVLEDWRDSGAYQSGDCGLFDFNWGFTKIPTVQQLPGPGPTLAVVRRRLWTG